jgi:NADP-dependent 3-hydroxy acid dehydrogenase YdfG
MNKIVLITGATSGIGKACAEIFAKEKYDIIITGRRQNRLDEITRDLIKNHGVRVHSCCFDVQDRKEVFKQFNELPEEWKKIDILVNNAGLALGKDPFDEADINDWDTMMHTNVDGLLYVTRAVLPYLKKSQHPHIINLGSVAGKEVYENGNVYCASKFAVDAISHSMRIDLLKYGIKVTAIHPGAVETEFSIVRFKGDETKANAAYMGYKPLKGEDIAGVIYYCASLPPHVCINDLQITCLSQADALYFSKEKG